MPKIKCEQCLKEVDRPRPQPYCSPECYQLALTKKKNMYLTTYEIILKDGDLIKFLNQANRESLQWQFEKLLKKETLKGSYKAFQKNCTESLQPFYEYVLNTVRVRRE